MSLRCFFFFIIMLDLLKERTWWQSPPGWHRSSSESCHKVGGQRMERQRITTTLSGLPRRAIAKCQQRPKDIFQANDHFLLQLGPVCSWPTVFRTVNSTTRTGHVNCQRPWLVAVDESSSFVTQISTQPLIPSSLHCLQPISERASTGSERSLANYATDL